MAATFFLLAAYIAYEAIGALVTQEGPEHTIVGLVLSVLSLLIMPILFKRLGVNCRNRFITNFIYSSDYIDMQLQSLTPIHKL